MPVSRSRLFPLLLCGVLGLAQAASSLPSVTRTVPLPGHAAGAFGAGAGLSPSAPGRAAAWSADSRSVFTLDTARELKRWRVSDGALLGEWRLRSPAGVPDQRPDLPTTSLRLSGVAGSQGLPLTVTGAGDQGPLRYTLNLASGGMTRAADCARGTPVPQSPLACAADQRTRAWAEGRTVRWARGDQVRTLPLPQGLPPQTGGALSLGLSADGRRLAVLALGGRDVVLGGPGLLLTWEEGAGGQLTPRETRLSGPALFPGATLSWVGEQVLVASNVFNTGDEFGSGGARDGQQLALVTPGRGAVWTLDAGAGLRGAEPSPDGQLFVTVRGGSVPELRRLASGGFVRALGAAVQEAAPLTGRRALLTVQDGAGFGRLVRQGPGGPVTLYRGSGLPGAVAVTRDEGRAAFAGGPDRRTLRLLGASGQVLREWRARGRVLALAFSPDGQVLSAQIWENDPANRVPNRGEAVQAWRVADGAAYPLPQGTEFPVSQVVIRAEEGRQNANGSRRLVSERGSSQVVWQTPWHGGVFAAQPSPDGRWLAQSGYTAATVGQPQPGRDAGPASSFSRVESRTGRSGPVWRVPVTQESDPYAVWRLAAFDGRRALLNEVSGDGCGGQLYGYALGDLQTGRGLSLPPELRRGYARFMGCGFYAPRPEAAFAPDGRLLIRDGNRLDWWSWPAE